MLFKQGDRHREVLILLEEAERVTREVRGFGGVYLAKLSSCFILKSRRTSGALFPFPQTHQ